LDAPNIEATYSVAGTNGFLVTTPGKMILTEGLKTAAVEPFLVVVLVTEVAPDYRVVDPLDDGGDGAAA